jgi:hypothetical protein
MTSQLPQRLEGFDCSMSGNAHHLACRCREESFSSLRLCLQRVAKVLAEVPEGGTLDWAQIAYLRDTVRGVLG